MKVIGEIIRCREKEFSNGQMEESMKEIISMTKNMDSVVFGGLMDENTKVNGKEAFSMEKANIKVKMVLGKKVDGNLESV